MTFLLHYKTPASDRRLVIRTGETARIGHSSWMELCIDDDPSLAEEHFSISYQRQLFLRALAGSQVEVDGNVTSSTTIHSGSKVIAGQCVFEFIQPHLIERRTLSDASTSVSESKPTCVWSDKLSLIDEVGLSVPAVELIRECDTPRVAIELLYAQNLLEDAVRLLAGTLSESQKILWCLSALKEFDVRSGTDFSPSLNAWLSDPCEASRIGIAQIVPWKETSSPWTWLLASITWTGGSLGTQGSTLIAPPRSMITSAIIASLQLSCCHTPADGLRNFCICDGLQRLTRETKE